MDMMKSQIWDLNAKEMPVKPRQKVSRNPSAQVLRSITSDEVVKAQKG